MKIQEEYERIRKDYNFPNFKELDAEFEIISVDIEKVNSLTRVILRLMCNRMGIFLNYLEPVITPTPQGLHAFIEVDNTTNEEKREIFEFYKKLSQKYHRAYSIELTEPEAKVAEEINSLWKEWKGLKSRFRELCTIINKAWELEKETQREETTG